jgi:hypothetical protein
MALRVYTMSAGLIVVFLLRNVQVACMLLIVRVFCNHFVYYWQEGVFGGSFHHAEDVMQLRRIPRCLQAPQLYSFSTCVLVCATGWWRVLQGQVGVSAVGVN